MLRCFGVPFVMALAGLAVPLRGETNLAELAKAPAGQKISYGSDPLQFGELHVPPGPGPHPVVINVHGGCWLAEYNIDHSRALANALAKEGIAVWNLEYRRVGNVGGGWPGTFLDVAAGAEYVHELAKKHPLDLKRVITVGHSAGGHFALWLAARWNMLRDIEFPPAAPVALRGVVALAPASELDELHAKGVCGNVIDKLMDGGPAGNPGRYRGAMPSAMAPLGVEQFILIGEHDKAWRPIGELYVERARLAGDLAIESIVIPDVGHFEVIDPGSSAWPVVLKSVKALLGDP